jgi:hypothetical protein
MSDRQAIGKPSVSDIFRVIPCLLALLGAACGSAMHHDSFSEFAKSLYELRDGADQALDVPCQWARERYIMETAAESADTVSGLDAVHWLILERDAESVYAWSMVDEPLYVTQRRFRRGVYELNSTLIGYAELLEDLAGADLSAAQFADRAEELNNGLRDASSAMGDTVASADLAIFSVATTEMLRIYLEEKKRDLLRQALSENQAVVETSVAHIGAALRLTALHLWHEYDEKTFELTDPLDPAADAKLKDRRKNVGGIVETNDVLTAQLETLRLLDDSYRALPQANRELYESLDNPEMSLSAIREIADNGRRLQRLYRELTVD